MVRDIVIGAWAAALIFSLIAGYDPALVVLAGGVAALAQLLLSGRITGQRFGVTNQACAGQKTRGLSFGDVGGQESAKRELVEALEFIRNEESAVRLGIRPLRGILLSGPPGTGKTLLARAAASYTDAAFISAAGSDFVEMYAGVGAKRTSRRNRCLLRI